MTQKSGGKAFSRREVLKAFGAVTGAVAVGPLLQACTAASGVPTAAPIASTEVPSAAAPAVANAGTVTLNLKKLDGTPVVKEVVLPKYGGVLNAIKNTEDTGWDDYSTSLQNSSNSFLVAEHLLQGDWTRGPAGTGEASWWAGGWYPQFEAGALAESWEIPDPETVIFHIRKGVHWALDPNNEASALVGGREFTADDAAYNLNRVYQSPKSKNGSKAGVGLWFIEAKATDKYTVVVKGKEEKVGVGIAFFRMADTTLMFPPEVIEKFGDVKDWKNVVGTGPFMVAEHVEGSHTTFKRNPNYWQHDPLFPENQLPYVDEIRKVFVTDQSARLSMLRTGKGDYVQEIPWQDAESLLAASPDLQYLKDVFGDPSDALTLRVDGKPFNDIRVRQAIAMAINRPAIVSDYYKGNAELVSYPIVNVPDFSGAYIPLEELPETVKKLWEYRPDEAKKLLAEAGYADGLTFTAVLSNDHVQIASIYAADLAKVGVTMNMDLREHSVYRSVVEGKEYKEACFVSPNIKNLYQGTYLRKGDSSNFPMVDDPRIVEYAAKLNAFENINDQATLDKLAKELNLYVQEQCFVIAPPVPYLYTVWQPWVNNFYGLPSVGAINYHAASLRVWIDQDLKKQ